MTEEARGKTLEDMDPDKREESVLKRCDRMLRTLDGDAQARIMEYLMSKANSRQKAEVKARMEAGETPRPHSNLQPGLFE